MDAVEVALDVVSKTLQDLSLASLGTFRDAYEGVLNVVKDLKLVINKPEEPRLVLVVGCEENHQVQIQPAKKSKEGVVRYEKRV